MSLLSVELGRSWRKSLRGALFDSAHYLLFHQDVARAVQSGAVPSAFDHYSDHGRREGRAFARRLLPFVSLPRLAATVRPDEDNFSGAEIRVDSRPGGKLTLIGFWLDGVRARRIVADIDTEAMIQNGRGDVMWTPARGSRGRRFLFILIDRSRGRRWSLAPFVVNAERLIHSAPLAPTKVPPSMVISPVSQCNLNCIHCISRPTRAAVNALSPSAWGQIQRYASAGLIDHVAADYSGDLFFADRKAGPWLQRFLDLKTPLRFDTHANDLTPEISRALMTSPLQGINFSLDSMDEQDYPRIRKGAKPLSQVLKNIGEFMKLRNAMRRDITTCISFVLMRRNLSSLPLAIDFAAEHGLDYVQCSHLMVFTPDMEDESALLDLDGYKQSYDLAIAYAAARNVRIELPPPVSRLAPRAGHQPCRAPWEAVNILGNGDVTACCMPNTTVGNLNEEDLEAIWNGPRMQRFRSAINSATPPSPCSVCPVYRHENNFESYVPGLSPEQRKRFVGRVLAQLRRGREVGAVDSSSQTSAATAGVL